MKSPRLGRRGYSNENHHSIDSSAPGDVDAGVRSGSGGGLVAGWEQGGGDRGGWAACLRSGWKVDAAAGEGCAEGGVVWRFASAGSGAGSENHQLERGDEISGAGAGDESGSGGGKTVQD